MVESLLVEVSGFSKPQCAFEIYDGTLHKDSVSLESCGMLSVGPILAQLLSGSTRFALFTATVGDTFQQFQHALKEEENILKSFIVDMIGTCMVESAGNFLESCLEKEIGKDRHTHRFSPGYCGWPLSDQAQLFRFMGGSPCKISLSDVFLMNPIKSISGIIGIGKSVDEKKYGCQYCELETCYKRKKKKK